MVVLFGGAEGDRTPDLMTASHALTLDLLIQILTQAVHGELVISLEIDHFLAFLMETSLPNNSGGIRVFSRDYWPHWR